MARARRFAIVFAHRASSIPLGGGLQRNIMFLPCQRADIVVLMVCPCARTFINKYFTPLSRVDYMPMSLRRGR